MRLNELSPRSLRRVVAQRARKAALTAANLSTLSAAKLAANRANAKHSTGAKTEAGHQASSRNALRHGMTAKVTLLTGADAQDYQDVVASHLERHAPVGDEENELVHMIAENAWKIMKAGIQEAAIYEVGRLEHPGLFFKEVEDVTRNKAMADAKIAMIYAKDLKNLHLQDRRVRLQHERDLKKLTNLQTERRERPKREAKEEETENVSQVTRAQKIFENCIMTKVSFVPAEFGFDFDSAEWDRFYSRNTRHFNLSGEHLNLKKFVAAFRADQETPPNA